MSSLRKGRGGSRPAGSRATSRPGERPSAPRRDAGRDSEPRPRGAPGAVDTPALALWLSLVTMLALRAVLAFVPAMNAWALNLQRFLDPSAAWGSWGVAALMLIPALARPLSAWAERAGDAIGRGRPFAVLAVVAIAIAVVVLLPDHVRFVGDFQLRQGTVEVADRPDVLFPQALPLEVWLHVTFPTLLMRFGLPDANAAARAIGAIEAALLAWMAVRMARALGARGAGALAATTVVVAGGYLALYTGYSKAFGELCVLVAWAAGSAVDLVRNGRSAVALGIAVAIAAMLHRSGLGLVPMAVVAWVFAARTMGRGALRQPRVLAALAIPLVTLAIMVPRIFTIVRKWDAVHFNPRQVQQGGGALAAALADHRAADILNLWVVFSPLALTLITVLPLVWLEARRTPAFDDARPAAGRAGQGAREAAAARAMLGPELIVLAALALPFVAVMPFIHPAQGMFRDWDDFATAGVALSLIVAWTLAHLMRERRDRAWLVLAVVASCVVPTLQWLAVHADLERGLARVRAFELEPPRRTDEERGKTWDYLGVRRFNLGMEALDLHRDEDSKRQFALAAEALEHAAKTSPSPRILQQWALATTMSGDLATAQAVYHRMLERDPGNALGWLGLATVSFNKQDFVEARRAANHLLGMQPDSSDAMRLIHDIDLVESGQARVP